MNTISILDSLTKFDQATPAERRILLYLKDCTKKKRIKSNETFVTRETIARKARCSIDTVKKFLNKNNSLNWVYVYKKKGTRCNHYDLSNDFFDCLILLELMGYDFSWQKCRERIMREVSEDEWYIHKKILKNTTVMNNENTRLMLQKIPTMNSFLRNTEGLKSTNHAAHVHRQKMQDKEAQERHKYDRAFAQINGLPLTYKQKLWLSANYCREDLKGACLDHEWYTLKHGHRVGYLFNFMCSRAAAQLQKRAKWMRNKK